MSNIISPPLKNNPLFKMINKMKKEKALKWAKEHGCYEEVKKYYELKEKIEKHVIY